MLNDLVRHAPEQERLHAAAAARAEHDDIRVDVSRRCEDRVAASAPLAVDPLVGDEARGGGALRAFGGDLARRLLLPASIRFASPAEAETAEAHAPGIAVHDRVSERLPDREHRRLGAGHQYGGAVDRRTRVGRSVVTH